MWTMLAGAVVLISDVAAVEAQRPAGARIEPSGFATIVRAPPSPTADVSPRRPTYRTVSEWYAQQEGLTLDEAKRRLGEQEAIRPVFQRLEERLNRMEPDNYVSARLNHQPDWSYTLYFKRDPEATLRRYSVNPRFRAGHARFTLAEAQAMAAQWLERFSKAKLYGVIMSPSENRVEITVPVSERAFREIAAREDWGEVPPEIRLSFAPELEVPRVDPRVAKYLRAFASESTATTLQMQRGSSGRVMFDNGCLRLAVKGKVKGPLVVFTRRPASGSTRRAIWRRSTGGRVRPKAASAKC